MLGTTVFSKLKTSYMITDQQSPTPRLARSWIREWASRIFPAKVVRSSCGTRYDPACPAMIFVSELHLRKSDPRAVVSSPEKFLEVLKGTSANPN